MQCFMWNSKFYWSNEPSLTFCDVCRQSYSACFNSKDSLVSAFLDGWLSVLTTQRCNYKENWILAECSHAFRTLQKKIKCLKISKYFLYLASSIITHFLVEKHVRVKIKEFVKCFKKEILMETN